MNARYSYPTKAEAEAYAERLRYAFPCGGFWNSHTLEGFLVAPHHYTLDNKPASWGVIARWRYSDRPDLGVFGGTFVEVTDLDKWEVAARNAGWRRGGDFGGFIFDGKEFYRWKEAASADDATTYDTWEECCKDQGIPPAWV